MRGVAVALVLIAGLSIAVTAGANTGPPSEDMGERLFDAECGRCHSPESLQASGVAGADFMMTSGRMPIDNFGDPVRRRPPTLDPYEISLINQYLAAFGGPPIPDLSGLGGDIPTGGRLYRLHCAGCHGATGVGGALVESRHAPSIFPATPLQVAEVIRAGPGPMPAYGEDTFDDSELGSLVKYVEALAAERDHGGWNLGRWGPVPEGAVAWLIGVLAVIGVAIWIEGTSRRTRREPEG